MVSILSPAHMESDKSKLFPTVTLKEPITIDLVFLLIHVELVLKTHTVDGAGAVINVSREP